MTTPHWVNDLPPQPGVYRFHGAEGELLYIGKSINIRQRVKSHFQSCQRSSRARRMCQLTDHIDYTLTAGELGALLLENREIKQRQPIFNRRQRRYKQLHTWILNASDTAFLAPVLHSPARESLWNQDSYGLYRSPRQARLALEHWIKQYRLCPKVCGLESGSGPCFSFQLGRCQGACCGKESPDSHNRRLKQALHEHQIQAWPYKGTLVIRECGATEDDYHLVHQWCHLATLNHAPGEEDLHPRHDVCFDLDSYRMLLHFLNRGIEHFVMP